MSYNILGGKMIPSINIDDLLKIGNAKIIDIRSIEKYNSNHIPNAINIPFEKLMIYHEQYLNKYTTYYIYCRSGITSKKACEILLKKGYRVVNIDGGYENWLLRE